MNILFIHQNFTGAGVMYFDKTLDLTKAGLDHARFSTNISCVLGSNILTNPSTLILPVSLGRLATGWGVTGC
jgi:hypothetical protein